MTNPLAPQVAVVAALLARFSLSTESELHFARDQLAQAVRLAQTHTAAYNIPLDQHFPDGVGFEAIAAYVNPTNVGASLLTLVNAANRNGFNLAVDGDLQIYNAGAWQLLAGTLLPQIPVNVTAAPAAPAPAPTPAPAPAPAPAAPPPPAPAPAPAPAAAQDLSGLVQSVLAEPAPVAAAAAPAPVVAPSTVAATPTVATAPTTVTTAQLAELFPLGVQTEGDLAIFTDLRNGRVTYDEAKARLNAIDSAAAPAPAAVPAPVSPPQASAPAPAAAAAGPAHHGPADGEHLPDSSVLAQRTGSTGRPQKSPFEGKIAERKSVAPAPYWWEHMRYSAKHVFAVNPAQALDPSSTGAAPVQSYAILTTLLQDVLKPLDPHTTVAEMRTFLREVDTGMRGLESASAVFQLADVLFAEPAEAK